MKDSNMGKPQFIRQVVDWLRVGYPDGIPENDYIPLFAILALKLKDKDIQEIATSLKELYGDKEQKGKLPVKLKDANQIITDTLGVAPTEMDLQRVRKKLRKKGVDLKLKSHKNDAK